MTQQTINIGTVANDGTGDPARTAFDKCNDNFTELYEGVGSTGSNLLARPSVNYIDPAAGQSVIAGGGAVGSSTRVYETGSDGLINEIGAHASYTAGTASVATIGGGYDNRNDQLAGTIAGGAHHLLNYQGSHGYIGGGSFHTVINASDYAAIGGGNGNLIGIAAAADNATIAGGYANQITQGHQKTIAGGTANIIANSGANGSDTIGGGSANVIYGTDDRCTISGGGQNSINKVPVVFTGAIGSGDTSATLVAKPVFNGSGWIYASGTYPVTFSNGVSRDIAFTVGGASVTFTALGSAATATASAVIGGIGSIVSGGVGNTCGDHYGTILGGYNNVSSNGGTVFGTNNLASGQTSLAYGNGSRAYVSGGDAATAAYFSTAGDTQRMRFSLMGSTSDGSTVVKLSVNNAAQLPVLPTGTVWAGTATVVATQASSTNVGMWKIPFVVTWISGSSASVVGGATTDYRTGADAFDATKNSRQIIDQIGVAALPIFEIWSGFPYPYVAVVGKSATNIRWAASIDLISINSY